MAKIAISHELSVEMRGSFFWKRDSRQRLAGLSEGANDLGRAWVVEADGTKRDINGGDLITREEALRLAAAGEYTLDTEE